MNHGQSSGKCDYNKEFLRENRYILINPFGDGPHSVKGINEKKIIPENCIQLSKQAFKLNGTERRVLGDKLKNRWL